MSQNDFIEWLLLVVTIPLFTLAAFLFVATLNYVYSDTRARSKSQPFAIVLTVLTALLYWPLSFLGFLFGTDWLDRKQKEADSV